MDPSIVIVVIHLYGLIGYRWNLLFNLPVIKIIISF